MYSQVLWVYRSLLFLPVLLLAACNSQSHEEDSLTGIVNEFNKKCPQMIDSETRIEGIDVKEPNTIIYKYTLVNLPLQNVDTSEFKKALLPGIISVIKLSPEMRTLRENATNFEYQYSDKFNKTIYTFKIFPKDYNP